MNKTKGLGKKLRTLRSGIRATPATLHLEITMLLHQQRRLHSELETIRDREKHLLSLLAETEIRIAELTNLADTLDPLGRRCQPRTSTIPSTVRSLSSLEKGSNTQEKEPNNSSGNFREMSLSY